MKYHSGPLDIMKDGIQVVRLGDGCPHACPWCKAPKEHVFHGIPEIRAKRVHIWDMNLLSYPNALEVIKELGDAVGLGHLELTCGIDYRFLTPEIAEALKTARFVKPRLAWDGGFRHQKEVKRAVGMLKHVCYRDISCFILCNHHVASYVTNLRKLDLLKVWGIKALDCYFDGQSSPGFKPIAWRIWEMRDFRKRCRKHNQAVMFGIDPEFESTHRVPAFAGEKGRQTRLW